MTNQMIQRHKEFKGRLDNSKVIANTLSKEEHNECYKLIQQLTAVPITSQEAEDAIYTLKEDFINKFWFHRPVDWHFKSWSKTSFKSDSFYSLLFALECKKRSKSDTNDTSVRTPMTVLSGQ